MAHSLNHSIVFNIIEWIQWNEWIVYFEKKVFNYSSPLFYYFWIFLSTILSKIFKISESHLISSGLVRIMFLNPQILKR